MAETTTRPDGYDALPRRFKDYITALENRAASLEAQQPVKTRTSIALVSYTGEEAYLPDGTVLEFRVGRAVTDRFDGRGDTFQVRLKDAALEVSSVSGSLAVEPQVSNVVHIVARRAR